MTTERTTALGGDFPQGNETKAPARDEGERTNEGETLDELRMRVGDACLRAGFALWVGAEDKAVEKMADELIAARATLAALSPAQTGGTAVADAVAFSATDRACYEYPGVDEQPLRAAFVAGAVYAASVAEGAREKIAQWLHDEVDFPDRVVGAVWPLHDNDDGYRGDGAYVRLQPKDVVEHFRDIAARLLQALDTGTNRGGGT